MIFRFWFAYHMLLLFAWLFWALNWWLWTG